jgi:hypothetical protein
LVGRCGEDRMGMGKVSRDTKSETRARGCGCEVFENETWGCDGFEENCLGGT